MRTSFCFLWLILVSPVWAQWRLASQSSPVALGHNVWQITKQVTGPTRVELQIIHFKTSECVLRVIDQLQKNTAVKMDEIAIRENAMAMCNEGYFSPDDFSPSGLQIAGGRRSGVFQKGRPFGGGIIVHAGKPTLYMDSEFSDTNDITEMVQCSPMLVNDGKALSEKCGGPQARRTFLLTYNTDHWALGIANRVGLRELADILTTSGIITEFKVMRALNLDGGPSTGLWWKDSQGIATYHKEMWPVKNLIIVTPQP